MLVVKNPTANARDTGYSGSILKWGRSPGGGNDNPSQYSCLENSMDRGACWATVHGFAETNMTELLSTHTYLSMAPQLVNTLKTFALYSFKA